MKLIKNTGSDRVIDEVRQAFVQGATLDGVPAASDNVPYRLTERGVAQV